MAKRLNAKTARKDSNWQLFITIAHSGERSAASSIHTWASLHIRGDSTRGEHNTALSPLLDYRSNNRSIRRNPVDLWVSKWLPALPCASATDYWIPFLLISLRIGFCDFLPGEISCRIPRLFLLCFLWRRGHSLSSSCRCPSLPGCSS